MGKPFRPTSQAKSKESIAAEIYLEVIGLPKGEREAHLRRRAGNDSALLGEVREMLSLGERPSELLKSPMPRPASAMPGFMGDPDPGMPLQPGDRIMDFEIIRHLGEGGFAQVYLARQVSLDREVALKVSANRGKEARILAHLEHDNIVKVFSEMNEPARNLRLICMQYVPGATLADVIDRCAESAPPISGASILSFLNQGSGSGLESGASEEAPLRGFDFQECALWIAARLANALDFAHKKGVLHLDVKPSNVLLDRQGRPYLTDFNVSLDYRDLKRGGPQFFGGTQGYMAPEQRAILETMDRRQAMAGIDHRADLFSLGVVIREFLGGVAARMAASRGHSRRYTKLLKQERTTGAEERWLTPLIGVDIGAQLVLEKCMAEAPEARFESARAACQAFEGCLEIREILKSMPSPGPFTRLASHLPSLVLSAAAIAPLWICSALSLGLWWRRLPSLFRPMEFFFGVPSLALFSVLGCLAVSLAWLWWTLPLARFVANPILILHNPASGASARRKLIGLPNLVALLTTFIWLPAHLFPLLFFTGGLDRADYQVTSFLFACFVAGLAAMGLAALSTQFFALRVIYPRLWLGGAEIRASAAAELRPLGARLRLYYLAVAGAPISCALLGMVSSGGLWGSKRLIGFSIVAGFLGILFDFALSHRLAQIVFAFRGKGRE